MYKHVETIENDEEYYDNTEVPDVLDRETGASTPSTSQNMLPRDHQAKTAYYDHATEKSLSNTEAKLIYQRHQLEQEEQTPVEGKGPFRRWATVSENEMGGLSRTASMASGRSRTAYRIGSPASIMTSGESLDNTVVNSPELNGVSHQGLRSPSPTYGQAMDGGRSTCGQGRYTQLPHETEPPLLRDHGIDGAGAGIGVGAGAGGFAINDSNVASELSAIYTNIQKILDLRHKYIRLSLQEPGDNPKDEPGWKIYPPPPDPVWDDEKDRPYGVQSGGNSLSNSRTFPSEPETPRSYQHRPTSSAGGDQPVSPTTAKKRRKAGQDIGEDFVLEDLLPLPGEAEMTFRLDENGVYQVYETPRLAELETPIVAIPTIRDFYMDLDSILSISSDGPTKSFAFRRLQYLEGKFNLYFLLNEYQEMADTKRVPHRDFYNVRKVDTHVHHSACMNQKHLLRFIKSKMKKSPDEVVIFRDGKYLTLREVFESINLTAYDLSIDTLDMHVS